MQPALRRILDQSPTPVAYTYSLVFDPALSASSRRWALCFTEYQLLRLVTLPLVGQYLRGPIDASDPERGVTPTDPVEEPLSDALERAFRDECETVLVAPDGRVAPLYPLDKPLPD
jgi:hypothetical protein